MKNQHIILIAIGLLGLTNAASALNYTYNFTTNGSDVGTASPVSPPAGSPTVTVTGWSTTNGSSWTSESVTQNGSYGMGVRSYTGDNHTVDNGVRLDFLLFYFGGASVDVNSFSMGYIDGDSDYRWAVGSPALPVNGNVLSSLYGGGTNVLNGSIGSNSINAANSFGTYLLIGARPEFDGGSPDGNDRFKVSQISISTSVPDAGSTVALLSLGLMGLFAMKRRFQS